MSKIDIWRSCKKVREQAEQWFKMKDTYACYDGKRYVPRIDVKPTLYMCGQEYAGAPNYHQPPTTMAEMFAAVIQKNWQKLAEEALEMLREQEQNARKAANNEMQEFIEDEKKESGK